MRKAKLFAVTLAAVTAMSITMPAFAGDQVMTDESAIESSMETENVDDTSAADTDQTVTPAEKKDDENVPAVDENMTEESSENTENAADDDSDMPVMTLSEFKNSAVSVAEPSGMKNYKNNEGMTVYESSEAVAYVNPEGTSGRIYINTDKLKKNTSIFGTVTYTISGIENVPLSDIIKFNDGGYVSSITCTQIACHTYDDQIQIMASGPSEGFGHLRFTDKTGDTYEKSIYLHEEHTNTVDYNSNDPDIKIIDWYSDKNDNQNFPDYVFEKDSYHPGENERIYVNSEGQTVYESKAVTAYVNPDGTSGHIDIDTSVLPFEDDITCKHWSIKTIAGVELKEIIKFNNNGYVSCINADQCYKKGVLVIHVFASGPSGILGGAGYLNFIPETGESDTLSIYDHEINQHELKLDTNEMAVKRIEWSC